MNVVEMARLEESLQKMLICSNNTRTAEDISPKDGMKNKLDNSTAQISLDIITDHLLNGDYEMVLGGFLKRHNYPKTISPETIDSILTEGPLECHLEIICVGVSALQLFVEINWTGKTNCRYSDLELSTLLSDVSKETVDELLIDDVNGEDFESISGETTVELLYIAILCLLGKVKCKNVFIDNWSLQWWQLRCLCVHQQILTEKSDAIYESTIQLIDKLETHFQLLSEKDLPEKRVQLPEAYLSIFNLEVSSFYANYFDVTNMAKVRLRIT